MGLRHPALHRRSSTRMSPSPTSAHAESPRSVLEALPSWETETGVLEKGKLVAVATSPRINARRFYVPNFTVRRLIFVLVFLGSVLLLRFVSTVHIPSSVQHSISSPVPSGQDGAPKPLTRRKVNWLVNRTDFDSIVHIVNTRFMQEQGPLKVLGKARLHQFETFCLASMAKQATQNFHWIIQTDPHLDPDILEQMVDLLRPYDHFYLIASNSQGWWNTEIGDSYDVSKATVYSGNRTRLAQVLAQRQARLSLETRLDADDGLHSNYLLYVQVQALKVFRNNPHRKWMYWCARRHLEWQVSRYDARGALSLVEHSKLCITAGMTMAIQVGQDPAVVPIHAHDKLYKNVRHSKECIDQHSDDERQDNGQNQDCVDLVEDLTLCAIRSRSFTSAGMQHVEDHRKLPSEDTVFKLWTIADLRFGTDSNLTLATQSFLKNHQAQIAYENWLGQCTSGHSCKKEASKSLQKKFDIGSLEHRYMDLETQAETRKNTRRPSGTTSE